MIQSIQVAMEHVNKALVTVMGVLPHEGHPLLRQTVNIMLNLSEINSQLANVLVERVKLSAQAATGGQLIAYEQDCVLSGRKIEAIKSVRNRTGVGLREAKDAVEKWMENNVRTKTA